MRHYSYTKVCPLPSHLLYKLKITYIRCNNAYKAPLTEVTAGCHCSGKLSSPLLGLGPTLINNYDCSCTGRRSSKDLTKEQLKLTYLINFRSYVKSRVMLTVKNERSHILGSWDRKSSTKTTIDQSAPKGKMKSKMYVYLSCQAAQRQGNVTKGHCKQKLCVSRMKYVLWASLPLEYHDELLF